MTPLKELFKYSNGALYWKVGCPGRSEGKKAGSSKPNSAGYLRVYFNGKSKLLHRVIWELHNGDIPLGFTIDHKDRNKLNNDISNLRLADLTDQQSNTKSKGLLNSKGVYFHKKCKKFIARITYRGEHTYLGAFPTEALAAKAYAEAALIQGEFNVGI